MTSVSLVGGGNWPKLLLETFSFQMPFRLVVCAEAGIAISAAAAPTNKIPRIFRTIESSSLLRECLFFCRSCFDPQAAGLYTGLLKRLRIEVLPEDAQHSAQRFRGSPQ